MTREASIEIIMQEGDKGCASDKTKSRSDEIGGDNNGHGWRYC